MIEIKTSNPFPLLERGKHSDTEARAHSAAVDRLLGLRTDEIEKSLAAVGSRRPAPESSGTKQELWFGLDVQALLTPYTELRSLIEQIAPQPSQCVVDLGAAYGRMGFVLARHFPEVDFIGYEFVGERVEEGRRAYASARLSRARLVHCDLSRDDFSPQLADHYFIYDFGTNKAIEKTLHDLRRLSLQREITIVARGRHCRYMIETRHPWLVNKFPLVSESRATIYRSVTESNLRWSTP